MKRKSQAPASYILPFVVVVVVVIVWFVYATQNQQTTSPQSFVRNTSPISQQNRPTPSSVLGASDNAATVGAKEFFIPFGYGTVEKATDWTDVPGMRATINSSLYPTIKQVILEVTPKLADDNQTVWVRLRNYDGYSYPAVSMNGIGPDLRLSSSFAISPGEKTYYIQAKTSGGSTTQIYGARLHITTY